MCNAPPLFVVILAAGKGLRMGSVRPKPAHALGGKPLISHVVDLAQSLNPQKIVIVVPSGPNHWLDCLPSSVETVVQERPLGTGHAASIGVSSLGPMDPHAHVLFLLGDCPLLSPQTLGKMRLCYANATSNNPPAKTCGGQGSLGVILETHPPCPKGYGHLMYNEKGLLCRIVESKGTHFPTTENMPCNAGPFLTNIQEAQLFFSSMSQSPSGEYYLTHIVEWGAQKKRYFSTVQAPWAECVGVNTQKDLAQAEGILQEKWRNTALEKGVSMVDPSTVYFSFDTRIDPDVILHPFVFLGPGVTIDAHSTIYSFCHIEGAHIQSGAQIGPFCRLRQGASVGKKGCIGNFVEIKNATLGPHTKAKHLSYVGDAHVGPHTNIGAGAVICNFDGNYKWQTTIEENVSIGANSSLVAPLVIQKGAAIGAGSVITKNVPPRYLAVERGSQRLFSLSKILKKHPKT